MPALDLSAAERREHRAAAHHLEPVVLIGAEGLSEAVVKAVDAELAAHGLIKVRAASPGREEREVMLATLAERLNAAPVQHIGRLLVLWRPVPPKERPLREDRGAGPRTVKLVSFSKSGNHRATVRKVKVFGNERVTSGGKIKRAKVRTSSVKKKLG
ncbi:MAG: YhbY family RNA-binding protein [Betaproteobacteria bacterium]|nr:YhbY family RNA-binding protein [Betaproteobacteria bacterium]MCC6250286.1 YhbY family RNA-binding protein [Rubrivivax sp.]MCL4698151.1 YhbY family RNA-binding protein [Burkholderiaceae bacterium]